MGIGFILKEAGISYISIIGFREAAFCASKGCCEPRWFMYSLGILCWMHIVAGVR
jgi:hypothetical protein